MNSLLNRFKTPKEIQQIIAKNVRDRRKAMNFTQEEFAKKCGVSFGSYKRFENKAEISLEGLVKIGYVLGCQEEMMNLFVRKEYSSIEEVIHERNS